MNRPRLALLVLTAVAVVAVVVVVLLGGDDGSGTAAGPVATSTDTTDHDPDDSGVAEDPGDEDPGTEDDAEAATTTAGGPAVDDEPHDDPSDDEPPAPAGDTAPPVGLSEPADFGDGVQARLASIEPTRAEARLPGERSGDALLVVVEITNRSGATIDVDAVTVDLIDASGASVPSVTDPDRQPLSGDVADGATASGEYVFSLERENRNDIRITVKYSADAPAVVFEGDAPVG